MTDIKCGTLKEPTLLLNEPNIKMLICGEKKAEWKSSNHIYYPNSFKSSIFTFVLCLKQFQNEFKTFKIPKFVLFEIINKFDRFDFSPYKNSFTQTPNKKCFIN